MSIQEKQDTQTQSLLLTDDDPFVTSLEVIPAEDWSRTWAVGKTIIWDDDPLNEWRCVTGPKPDTEKAKSQFVWRQLAVLTYRCHIIILELTSCDMISMEGQD